MKQFSSEAGWLAVCAAILVWKLFLPGFIGMADNGDFGKVAGPLCLASAEPERENFFHALYLRRPANCIAAPVPTSELALAGLASGLERFFADHGRFDIRWLGAIHALIFLAFYPAVLRLLRPLGGFARVILSLLALWIFADIGVIAYFNSFFTDTAAILGALAAFVLATELLQSKRATPVAIAAFGAASLLLVASKAQHALAGPIVAALAVAIGWRMTARPPRLTAALMAAVLLFAAAWTVAKTPAWYRNEARFDVVFLKIAKNSPAPARDLRELGLRPEDIRYIGLNSYVPGGPMNDPRWAEDFGKRCTDGRVIRYYLRHPGQTLGILRDGLTGDAWQRRDPEQANFTRASGRPEGQLAMSFGSWSELQTWILRKWPVSIALWLLLWPAVAVWLGPPACASVALSLAALCEFATASLGDAVETPRHLFLFHVYCDLSLFLALVFATGLLEACCPVRARRLVKAAGVVCLAVFAAAVGKYEVAAAAPSAPRVEAPIDATDDASPAVVYSGKWRSGAFGPAFRGTLTFTDETGAAARYSFEGTELRYFYTKAPNRGMALVTIDGVPRGAIDLYAPQIVWQASTDFRNLPAGTHAVEIRALGTHNADSSGSFVDIDAFAGR